jgi:hypothetical protein
MAREYQAMREANLRSAWANGGDFEGKKATDEVLLKFYRDKLADLSPDDPAANEVRNTLVQYEFAIENSKMETNYALGKVSDSGMAAFYRKWAGKLPVDSEGYRARMKLSGQYADRAASSGRAAASEAKAKRYGVRRDEITRNNEVAYDTIIGAVTDLAKSGVMGLGYQVLNTAKEGLDDVRADEMDATHLMQVFDLINSDPRLAPWRAQLTAYIRENGDPKFNGDYSYNNVVNVLGRAKLSGIKQRTDLARAFEYKGDVTAGNKEGVAVRGQLANLSSIDERARYEEARAQFDETQNRPMATLAEKWDALVDYRGEVADILTSVQKPQGWDRKATGDVVTEGRLSTELRALYGDTNAKGQTLMEESRGAEAGTGAGAEGDAVTTAMSVFEMTNQIRLLTDRDPYTGQPNYVQTLLDKAGKPTASLDDAVGYGVAPIAAVKGQSVYTVRPEDAKTKLDFGNGTVPGGSIVTAIVGVPVTMVGVQHDERGQPVAQVGDAVPIGMRFTLSDGTSAWSYTDQKGALRYATTNPFVGETNKTATGDEVIQRYDSTFKPPKGFKLDYATVVDPNFYSVTGNSGMPNTVFNSIPAAEMGTNPANAYAASPEEIQTALLAQANGDPLQATALYDEVDQLRANYVSGGDFAVRNRLTAARARGDLAITADYVNLGRDTSWQTEPPAQTREQAAIDKLMTGSNQELMSNLGQSLLKKWGITTMVPGSTDWKKAAIAADPMEGERGQAPQRSALADSLRLSVFGSEDGLQSRLNTYKPPLVQPPQSKPQQFLIAPPIPAPAPGPAPTGQPPQPTPPKPLAPPEPYQAPSSLTNFRLPPPPMPPPPRPTYKPIPI